MLNKILDYMRNNKVKVGLLVSLFIVIIELGPVILAVAFMFGLHFIMQL